MKTIKIIDLLNKIANSEEVPKKIKFCYRTFEYNGISDYLCIDKNDYSKEDYCNGYSIHKWIFGSNLNDEVEILEEEKKIPKKIKSYYDVELQENCIYEEGNKKNEEKTLIHLNTYNRLLEKLKEFKTIKELKPLAEEMERIIEYELIIWV